MVLIYPNIEQLRLWVRITKEIDDLNRYLPLIDERWFIAIESDFVLCAMHPEGQNIFRSSARLFHRIIKNHHFVDGNKRSALLAWFLFLYLNNVKIHASWEMMYDLARLVAESSAAQEEAISALANVFSEIVVFHD